MKTKILIASMTIALISSLSFANSVIESNVLGRSFCQYSNGHLKGWGFAKDGIAYNINSLAGMPDPSRYYQIEYITDTNHFTVNEYSKDSNELIFKGEGHFEYDLASDGLRSGDIVLTAKQCGN